MSVADSLYNLQLVTEFCGSSLKSSCSLAVEDLLYAPPVLHVSIPSSHRHAVRERCMVGNVLAHCPLWALDAWYCWLNFFWPGSNSPPSSMQHPFALHGNQTCSFPQLNIMSFISELLEQFEVKKPDFVKPIQPVNLTGSWLPTCFWGLNFYDINCVINKKNHSDELKVPCLLYMFFRHLRATRLYESCQREQQQVTESH